MTRLSGQEAESPDGAAEWQTKANVHFIIMLNYTSATVLSEELMMLVRSYFLHTHFRCLRLAAKETNTGDDKEYKCTGHVNNI